MSKDQQSALTDLKAALSDLPPEYQGAVCASLTHDISVIKKTLSMAEQKGGK